MSVIESLSNTIEAVISKYAFVLENGSIIKSTISEENLIQITGYISNICDRMEPESYIHSGKLYIYRVTAQFLFITLTDLEEPIMEQLLADISNRFSIKLSRAYKDLPKSFNSIIKTVLFSMARAAGPEPVAWTPTTTDEATAFKICMKTMLNLTGELEGAHKRMMSFQAFVQHDAIGIVFLFQVPFKNARGLAYDSSLTILADYNERAIVYEKNKELEQLLDQTADEITEVFNRIADPEGNFSSNEEFLEVLTDLNQKLENMTLEISKSDEVMTKMLESIKELKNM